MRPKETRNAVTVMQHLGLAVVLISLVACSGGDDDPAASNNNKAPTYTISGTVNNLSGSTLVLQNTGLDDLSISATGSVPFTFSTPLKDGASYNITVSSQPNSPGQICNVTDGVGSIVTADVTGIIVNCITNAANTYSVGGQANNLLGQGLTINNADTGDTLILTGTGVTNFTFPTTQSPGQNYSVGLTTQPSLPNQDCIISNNQGPIVASNINDIAIDCTTVKYTISGKILNLAGKVLKLQINDGEILTYTFGAVNFAFAAIDDGSTYNISVISQPNDVNQICTVTNGNDQLKGSNVSNVVVDCKTISYKIGGVIENLKGSGLVLNNNANNETLPISGTGLVNFQFPTPLLDSAAFSVSVLTDLITFPPTVSQPVNPKQECTSTNNFGSITGADISSIVFTCVDLPTYSIGGIVSGLSGSGLVLQNNGGDDLTISGTGMVNFTFPKEQNSGETYEVTIKSLPTGPTEECTVQQQSNGPNFVSAADITNIYINCQMDYFWQNPLPHGDSMYTVKWLNGGLNALTYDGELLTSTDAVNWSRISLGTLDYNKGYRDIVWTGTGGQYVIVGASGNIKTSTDGITWVPQTSGTTNDLHGIVWTGGVLVAVGNSGTILTSPDGENWTTRNSTTLNQLADVAWNGSTLLIAVGGDSVLASETGGATWAEVDPASGFNFGSVVWTGSKFVAVGSTGSIWPYAGMAATSSNGLIWKFSAENSLPVTGMYKMTWTGTQLIATTFDGNATATSPDGITWTNHPQQTPFSLSDVTWTGSQLVTVGQSGAVATSTDGIKWTPQFSTLTNVRINDLVWAGNQIVAVGGYGGLIPITGASDQVVLTSPTGNGSWTVQSTGTTTALNHAAYSGTTIVAVGWLGHIISSTNGVDWTTRSSGTTQTLNNVIWIGNQFVVVGDAGVILTSPDGVIWTAAASGATQKLTGVAYNGSTIVTVGNASFFSNDDGLLWTKSTGGSLANRVMWLGTSFIALNKTSGFMYSSTNGEIWKTASTSFTVSSTDLIDTAWNGNTMAVLGKSGQVFLTKDGQSWQELNGFSKSTLSIEWVGNRLLTAGYGGIIRISE